MKQSIVQSMMNSASKSVAKKQELEYKVHMLDLDLIFANDENFYGIRDIDDLADSIELIGLKTPIEVEQIGDKYRIIAGHRRYNAYKKLQERIESGKYNSIPAFINNNDDDLLKRLAFLDTNKEVREVNDLERAKEANEYKEILLELKERDGLPGRIKDLVAKRMKISASQAQRLMNIDSSLVESGKELLAEGSLQLSSASEIAKLDEDKQNVILEKLINTDRQYTRDEVHELISDIKDSDIKHTFFTNEDVDEINDSIGYLKNLIENIDRYDNLLDLKESVEETIKHCKQINRRIDKVIK